MTNSLTALEGLRSGVHTALLVPDAKSVARRPSVVLKQIPKGQPLAFVKGGCAIGVISGTGCLATHTRRGKRQVLRFLMAGDVFGFWDEDPSVVEGEAVTDMTVAVRRRFEVLHLIEEDPVLSAKVLKLAAREQAEARERMQLISWSGATVRLAWFLLKLMERNTAKEREPFSLPFRRGDIADYLALTVETICRAFTELKAEGLIAEDLRQHVVTVEKEKRLRQIAESY